MRKGMLMNTFEKVKSAADSLNIPAFPDWYYGDDLDTYITYNMSEETPDNFGDDHPNAVLATVQVHLFMPCNVNFFELRNNLRKALYETGLSYPSVVQNNIDDGTTIRHIVFECEDDEDEEFI